MRGKKVATRPNAFTTDIKRTITGNLKRFISLFIITALGATMLVGLKAACDDLRFTADSYYDDQRLYDISVRSTLGLSSADVEALGEVSGIEVAEGGYAETAYTSFDDARHKVDVKALSRAGINEPRVLDGRLPRDVDEVAVTQKYLDASGKHIGDTVTFEGVDDGTVASAEARPDDEAGEGDGRDSAAESTPDAHDAASKPIFERRSYTITGSVLDPMDVNAGSKSMGFRSTGGAQYAFFLTPAAVLDRDTFTVAYLAVEGASDLMTYSPEYDELIDAATDRVEAIREERELARTQQVKDDAAAAIGEKEAEVDERLEEAASQIDDGLVELEAGRAALEREGSSAKRQLAEAQRTIDASREKLEAGLATIDGKQAELDAGRARAEEGLRAIGQAEASMDGMLALVGDNAPVAQLWRRLQAGDATAKAPFVREVEAHVAALAPRIDDAVALVDAIDRALADMQAGSGASPEQVIASLDRLIALVGRFDPSFVDDLTAIRDALDAMIGDEQALASSRATLKELRSALVSLKEQVFGLSAQAGTLAEAVLGKPGVIAALAQVDEGQAKLDEARDKANQGLGQLDAAQRQLDEKRAEARRQLAAGKTDLAAGAAELASGQEELAEQRASAEASFADARRELGEIDLATWYIQDRSSLASYASVESDASSIESIATVFPLIFFTVAVLISLTTVTRMVEEDRGLIGVYKALGYGRGRILSKYLIYSFSACLAGGLAGDVLGFIALPEIIFTIFRTMYALPAFELHFNAVTACWGVGLFAIGIVGATFVSCRLVLRETPASLMRPKAPRAGKRILLERITPVWRHLSFLNKVSARNLFRYKKRFLMTVFGIAGCTALMICGLGIRDTVISLKPRQYGSEGIVRYDLMAVTADADFSEGERELRDTGKVKEMIEARVDSVTVEHNGVKESVQIVVVPRDADLSAYMRTEDGSNTAFLTPAGGTEELELPREGNGVLITKNVEQVLGFGVGDELSVQDSTLRTGTVRVDGITVNYLGNFVFMTEDAYGRAFGEKVVPNAFLANLNGTDDDKIALADELSSGDTFVTVSSSTKIANDFSESFKIIDVVVYIVTVMAAALAFAVVFTLSNTNISERERELATIKVLGFRRREVYRYINKETIVLTLIGIVAGWPLGYVITRFLTYVLRMPSLFFDTIVEPGTYVFASVMSLVFTLIINQMTNRTLDRIDMVGALKSAE